MVTRVYVPKDSTALSLGADEVVAALRKAKAPIEIIRTGTRGMLWLEPLVEVETSAGRIAYGPVSADDVPGLLAAGLLTGA